MAIPLTYNLRSLLVRKATTAATAFGIALVVFVLASSLMLSRGIKQTLMSSGSVDKALILRKGSDSELASGIENKYLNLILAAPGVKRDPSGQPLGMGEVIVVAAMNKTDAEVGQIGNVLVRGVQNNVYSLRPQVRLIQGRPAQPGTDEAVVGKSLLGRYEGLTLGSSFDLKKNRPVQIVGVFDSDGSSFESEVWVDLETLRTSFGREGLFSSLTIMLEDAGKYDAFAAVVDSDKQLGLESFRERDYYDKQSENTSLVISTLGIISSFFFSIGAMIGAMITMYGSVSQRSREIGTLRALGFSRRQILGSFLLESCALALGGAAVGAGLSLITSFFKLSTMNYDTWQEVTFTFHPAPDILLISVLAGGLMGVIGGFLPALSAARTSPIEAMRT